MTNSKNSAAGETAIKRFDYEGSPITFASGESVMVNATQMAKKFGKKVNDWLKTQQTNEFLQELTVARKIVTADFQPIRIVQGGKPSEQGTWMHEDVAMEFARWLSPKFAIWCNDRIKELARNGVAVVSDDDAVIAHAMQVLQKRLDEKQALIQAQGETITQQEDEIERLSPMADYTREVLQSTSTYTLTQVAKDLGFQSVHKFTQWAQGCGILYYQSSQWLPTSRYSGKGWFDTRTAKYVKGDGSIGSSMTTVVTESGRAMLHTALENWNRRMAAKAAKALTQTAETVAEEGGAA